MKKPKNELDTLTEQTGQVPAGEGTKEQDHFLHISLGSSAGLETRLTVSGRRLYMSDKANKVYLEGLDDEMRILVHSIHKLEIYRLTGGRAANDKISLTVTDAEGKGGMR